jgi:hypothetical protein
MVMRLSISMHTGVSMTKPTSSRYMCRLCDREVTEEDVKRFRFGRHLVDNHYYVVEVIVDVLVPEDDGTCKVCREFITRADPFGLLRMNHVLLRHPWIFTKIIPANGE